jgi:AraC-like DNA-binding protein
MHDKNFKIGYSDIGGIFVGKDIQSDFHRHYAVTVLISFGEPFGITTKELGQDFYTVAIIRKNAEYSLQGSIHDYMAFIHIVPYSGIGINLSDQTSPIRKLDSKPFQGVIKEIRDWFNSSDNNAESVEHLLQEVSLIPGSNQNNTLIDDRIMKSFDLITQSDNEKIPVSTVAREVSLSVSHFNRLFKKETGLTFRKFVLHSKLIKSIYAMYRQNNLTQASFIGGFSDQSHLSRTFKNNFGIKPSASLK